MTSITGVVTLKGFVQALPRSSGEEAALVSLLLQDGTEVPILHKGAGVDLVDHISADVEIVASFEEDPRFDDGKALRVRSYKVVDGFEDPWYDDEDD